ncbi:hypothetical protein ACJIZ3_025214 [Penstemon smallii]|uniref:Homeobox-leucine zipper protein n=1 Tax=Penstemon smallii TaxID=265156 RepID=A0ABD3TW79_9LAMI
MEGGRDYDDSNMTNALMKNKRIPSTSEVLDSLWVTNSPPSFRDSASMSNFEDVREGNNTQKPFFKQIDTKLENNCNDEFDVCFHQPEKKRRLLPEQVQFLEKSFEVENKLEPERKVQLAKELGLQPRQVAIWFQNRRARYKSKLLEKEYDSLKSNYDKLKDDYDTLYKDNEKMKNEVHLLKEKVLLRKDAKPKQEPCEPNSPLDLHPNKPNLSNSAKSDVFDSDSPREYVDGNHSTLLEPADSSHVFELEANSDFSQEENDSLGGSLLPTLSFPKVEIECYDDLQPNSCNLGYPVQDQGTWFWQY